jgi:glucokinase
VILAGDVGGTKTLLGLFDAGERRPRPRAIRSYPTNEFTSFTAILDAFARDEGRPFEVHAAAAGVAGPVVGTRARLTKITWDIDAREITRRFGTQRVRLLNDLEAMGYSAEVLTPDEIVVLQAGVPRADGNAVIIAAGTGLGEAYLHRVDGRLRPLPSEGGHADFAPRTDREIEFLKMMRADYGRAEFDQVLSGPGLLNLHRFTHGGGACAAATGTPPEMTPAAVSAAALARTCARCEESLAMFVSLYGAEAGSLALRGVATAGVYVGGGIAPKILPALQDGRFLEAFRDKAPLADLVAQMPVKVILNPEAGLIGAAVFAQEMLGEVAGRRR